MLKAIIKAAKLIICHRALYGAMALIYGAASFGLDKYLVNNLAFAIYLALAARG